MARVDEQHSASAADPWLELVLGLISVAKRLDDFVAPDGVEPTLDQESVYLLLGAVSLRRKLAQRLDELAPVESTTTAAPEPGTHPSGLLR